MVRDFASMEGLKSGGILYVFPAFQTAPAEQKIRHPPAGDLFRGSLSLIWKAPPVGVVDFMILGLENHKIPSHYDLHIKNLNPSA